nr:MAG TPA: hypothetical protein [Caudoviricetes sp.]
MSKLTESLEHTIIGDLVHVYVAPIGSEMFDLPSFEFTGEDIGAWKWLGDTSADSLPEFEKDDDKDSNKRTADQKNTRSSAKMTGTINALSISKRFFELVTEGGILEDDGYTVTNTTKGRDWTVAVISEDGAFVDGFRLFAANLSTTAIKKQDLENYGSIPVKVKAEYDKQGRLQKTFYVARRKAAGSAPAVAAVPGG